MCIKSFFKRIVPFFLTFAVGLFIASFFITVAAPNLRFPNRGERKRHQERDRRMEQEIQRLQERNFQLEQKLADKEVPTDLSFEYAVPPPPPLPPYKPIAPRNR